MGLWLLSVCLTFAGLCKFNGALSLEEASSRREWLVAAASAATTAVVATPGTAFALPMLSQQRVEPSTAADQGRFFFPALTPPFRNRATYRYALGRNMWALEQLLTFANVTATIRTNVVRMQDGGLWVHSPLYPTGEYCALLDELGPVKHVVLPCNAFEHKAPLAAFCKKYPEASVWIAPGQYGPLGKCGLALDVPSQMGIKIDGIFAAPGIMSVPSLPPWSDEFDFTTLYVDLPQNAGPVSEVAFVHRPTKTLIVTDAVVYIPKGPTPPAIFGTYFSDSDMNQDPSFWAKSVLQAIFLPLRTNADGSYPGFEAISERLVRAPILRGFNDARAPNEIRAFVQQICQWPWDRIVSSHFASPVAASAADLADAFAYLEDDGDWSKLPPLACRDWELLDGLNEVIAQSKLGAPATFDYTRGCL